MVAREEGVERGNGGKIKWKLSEVNTSAVSRGQNKLIGKFKMVSGDVISILEQVIEYSYIPTGVKREFVRFGMDCNRKGYIVGTVGGGPVAIHSSKQTFNLTHIEGIKLGIGEKVDKVAG